MDRDELMKNLERTMQGTFRALQKGMNSILGDNINRSEFYLLRFLKENGPAKVSLISSELKVTASHITAVGDSLVTKGYIERNRSSEDRRIVELSLSDHGKQLFNDLNLRRTQYLYSTLDDLTDAEISELITLFNKFNLG
ncbi:MarR family winged helix-turn-helix transcriptional regulator [Bacillus salitolerans]|uniref:MarR family winged helix-turn-helix transcriptional regulator n=1 Tax=Bacillus salitolerans TaxID=1437434 RepID=A0ABW4LJD6_9BACI